MTPEERIASPEFIAALQEAARKADAICEELRKAREVPDWVWKLRVTI